MPKIRSTMIRGAAAVLALVLLTATAAVAAGPYSVRVPAAAVEELDALALDAPIDLDYGGFRWLVLEAEQLDRLEAAGVTHTKVAGADTVQVLGYRFDPLVDGEPDLPSDLRAPEDRAGFRLVQLIGPPTDQWLAQLESGGVELLQYYPHNTYLVWAEPNEAGGIESLPFVRWQGLFHPAYKINSDVVDRVGTIRNVDLMFYAGDRVEATLDDFTRLGATVIQHHPAQPDRAFYSAILEVDAAKLVDLARLDHVLWMGYESTAPTLDDEMAAQIVAGNHPGGVPVTGYFAHLASLGYDGSGVIWAVVDTGVDYDHPDLNTRIVGGYSFPGACNTNPGDDCAGGGHGTHVAGIIGGDATGGFTDGSGFLYGLGIAPGYSIFAMNSLSGGSWPPAGGWQEHSKRAVLGGAIGGNNSWTTGEGTQHGYQASERTHDIMILDGNFDTTTVAEPFIEVFSAGNSGSSGLTAPKEAKNNIVTASSRNFRVGSIDSISGFSSRGPAVDGRWVPTVAAPGEQIASTRNDLGGSCGTPIGGTNGLYSFCSGTSMAAPQTSGVITLATEWWRSFNAGADPSPAMAKALVVNSAVDMGTADIPNTLEGWGRVNVTNLVAPPVLTEYREQPEVFGNTGESWTLEVGIDDPTEPLKVTLAWADAPGAVGANPALVNNLDLEVTTGGSTYLGNVFSGGWSTSGGSADAINNLENVYVQSPGADATIVVNATNIAGDAILYNGDPTDQSFALVCSNCVETATFTLAATPPSLEVCAPADAQYTVDVGAILGFNDPVTLAATGNPAGTSVGFSTNPVTPVGSSTMTIGNTGAASVGSYTIEVSGTATPIVKNVEVGLHLFDAAPGAVSLSLPINGAVNQPARPTFEWSAASQAGSYRLQVATDDSFSSPVIDEAGITGTSYTPTVDLATNTLHFWRVRAANGCGDGGWSPTFEFTTEALPGDCSGGSSPMLHLAEDFESGAAGWSHSGSGDTWSLSGARVYSGAWSFHASDVGSVTDQRLVSPPVDLPAGQSPLTLQFWNWQEMESSGPSSCWDGGIVEISNNGGSTWTQLLDLRMLTDPYDGPVETNASNPLSGLRAWCGDPQDWLKSVVDIDDWAGQTVQFRWRLGTDVAVSREGWYLDDVSVQSCDSPAIFTDGFESGDTSAWSATVD